MMTCHMALKCYFYVGYNMNKNNTLEDTVSKEPDNPSESTITEAPVKDVFVNIDDEYVPPPLTLERIGGCSFRWADIEEDDEF